MANHARFARLVAGAYLEPIDWPAWNADMDARTAALAATEREIAARHAAALTTLGEAIDLLTQGASA